MKNKILQFTSTIANLLPPDLKKGLYRLGPATRFLRAFLNRVSPHGLSQVTIASGGNRGLRMELDLQAEKDYWLGTYEIDLQEAAHQLVQKDWIVYDVGANIGYLSLLFANIVEEGGGVFSFEPLPENLARLKKNIQLNQLQDRVSIVPCAVIDGTREVRFLVGSSGAMGKAAGSAGRVGAAAESEYIIVPGISLDDFVFEGGNPPPQVVKMDIEGGEVLALPGMTRLLAERRPLFFLELHGESAAKAAWEIFREKGYRLHKMAPGLPPVAAFEALNWKSYLVALS